MIVAKEILLVSAFYRVATRGHVMLVLSNKLPANAFVI
jgi:hypothetical protein